MIFSKIINDLVGYDKDCDKTYANQIIAAYEISLNEFLLTGNKDSTFSDTLQRFYPEIFFQCVANFEATFQSEEYQKSFISKRIPNPEKLIDAIDRIGNFNPFLRVISANEFLLLDIVNVEQIINELLDPNFEIPHFDAKNLLWLDPFFDIDKWFDSTMPYYCIALIIRDIESISLDEITLAHNIASIFTPQVSSDMMFWDGQKYGGMTSIYATEWDSSDLDSYPPYQTMNQAEYDHDGFLSEMGDKADMMKYLCGVDINRSINDIYGPENIAENMLNLWKFHGTRTLGDAKNLLHSSSEFSNLRHEAYSRHIENTKQQAILDYKQHFNIIKEMISNKDNKDQYTNILSKAQDLYFLAIGGVISKVVKSCGIEEIPIKLTSNQERIKPMLLAGQNVEVMDCKIWPI